MKVIFSLLLLASTFAYANDGGLPACTADVHDEKNYPVQTLNWKTDFYTDTMRTLSRTMLITTSLGLNQVMSLWVREKVSGYPTGMMVFVDLSSGKEQSHRLYMPDGYSVAVRCIWEKK